MRKGWSLTQQSFDELLDWLAPENRDSAAVKYEEIRRGLIALFTFRGCADPEALADETINRAADKAAALKSNYEGDVVRYFYGIAHNVCRESVSPKLPQMLSLDASDLRIEAASDTRHNSAHDEESCLKKCLAALPENKRKLFLEYYSEEQGGKIDKRQILAESIGLALNNLRVKVFRVKQDLKNCLEKCLAIKKF